VRVKLILPALTEALSPFWRPIKYSLFPPLGLATLAAYLSESDSVELLDEHVEPLTTDDAPDMVGIQVYITSAKRAYRIADTYRRRGVHVVLGGLHVTALPAEAAPHADTVILGPAEDAWPQFLRDFRSGAPRAVYRSHTHSLATVPAPRRDLINRHRYLVPNSIVVTRGCPHACDFCYKTNFFRGGASFYTRTVDVALTRIDTLPGRHLFFLDDHLLADAAFARALFEGMMGMGRVWQAAATVSAVSSPGLVERAAASGLRSLFIGYWRAYQRFYSWGSILRSVATKPGIAEKLRHIAYTGGWKKCEWFWHAVIGAGLLPLMVPVLEGLLTRPQPRAFSCQGDRRVGLPEYSRKRRI